MGHPNLDLIQQFFQAYGARDEAGIRKVVAENVTWTFPGNHPLSGVKTGISALIEFFDQMGAVMGSSHVQVESLVTGANDAYVVECQHMRTRRKDGNNLDQYWSVLWSFENGKITAGRHLASDQEAVDRFFSNTA